MLSSPEFAAIITGVGAIMIALSGILLMLQQRRLAGRVFLAGVLVAVGAALLPRLTAGGNTLGAVSWELAAVTAALVMAALRQWGLAAALAAPFIIRLAWPDAGASPAIIIAVLLMALVGVGLLARLLAMLIGREAAGHVVGEYTVRFIDSVFGGSGRR